MVQANLGALLGTGGIPPPPALPPQVSTSPVPRHRTPPPDEAKDPVVLPEVPADMPRSDIANTSYLLRLQPNMTVEQIGRLLDMYSRPRNASAAAAAQQLAAQQPAARPNASASLPLQQQQSVAPPDPSRSQEVAPRPQHQRAHRSLLESLVPSSRKRYGAPNHLYHVICHN